MIDQDDYGTVINSDKTFTGLAFLLLDHPVIFAWTDGHSTHLDIMMAYKPQQFGHLQRGMRAPTDLFVAVSGYGMFGFGLNGAWKSPGYVGEKLGLGGHDETTAELAELINGIIEKIEIANEE